MKALVPFLLFVLVCCTHLPAATAATEIVLWLPPSWNSHPEEAKKLTEALSDKSGLHIAPQIATTYHDIMKAFAEKKPQLAYVGSMAQAVIFSRKLGVPLFQAMNGKQQYGQLMIFAKGESPESILNDSPESVAYITSSSSEMCAKAATGGMAALGGMKDFKAAAEAVTLGTARAAFVKNYWWDDNKTNYPQLDSYHVPDVSDHKNPDNVMIASKFVAPEVKSMLMGAAITSPEIFTAELIVPYDSSALDFTFDLMKRAGIDPLTYIWPE